MRKRILLGGFAAALAMLGFASVVFAQSSGQGAAKFGGVATGAGIVSRTITDVGKTTAGTISVSVSPGQTAATVAQNFRNQASSVLGSGYSGVTTTPGSVADPTRIKIVRQTGGYNVSGDSNTAPGITFTSVDPFTVLDAPALSPVGLGFLFGALPALAFWRPRRRKSR